MILEKRNAVVFESNGFEEAIAVSEGTVGSNIEKKFRFLYEFSVRTDQHLKALLRIPTSRRSFPFEFRELLQHSRNEHRGHDLQS
jgi:hypothetical protein